MKKLLKILLFMAVLAGLVALAGFILLQYGERKADGYSDDVRRAVQAELELFVSHLGESGEPGAESRASSLEGFAGCPGKAEDKFRFTFAKTTRVEVDLLCVFARGPMRVTAKLVLKEEGWEVQDASLFGPELWN